MLGMSCLVEFCVSCVSVVHFEYTVLDVNYTNILSIIKTIYWQSVSLLHPNSYTLSPLIFYNNMNKSCARGYPVNFYLHFMAYT